ncbi:Bud site selection protein 6 [Xylographa carneopallida]|nr:Bud site selection protein 6 [Xylographa carneopallida]
MQPSTSSQRSAQRRSPAGEIESSSGPSQPVQAPSSSFQSATSSQTASLSGSRNSASAARPPSNQRRNPSQQLSQIEKSVTHLLIATKQLLECLTQWSRQTATESEVSDVYVRLGYEFNIACRAFNAVGVETADLGPVPEKLRAILEDTLSQDASTASLDKYLPRIRDIIINLLHGLKRKQQKLRQKQGREAFTSNTLPAQRTLSNGSTSTVSGTTSLTQMLDEVPQHRPRSNTPERRNGNTAAHAVEDVGVPPRTSSVQNVNSRPMRTENSAIPPDSSARSANRDGRPIPHSISDSSLSSNTMQALPILSPEEYRLPIQRLSTHEDDDSHTHPPPPPPPKQQDALAALQRGGDLERRASRRYSAYQISKHLGASPSGVPMLPPTQNTPIPNRGKDVRDSLNAVRTRGSFLPSRQKSAHRGLEQSPTRGTAIPRRISEEPAQNNEKFKNNGADRRRGDDTMTAQITEDKLRSSHPDFNETEKPLLGATLNGPPVNGIDELLDYDTSRIAEQESQEETATHQQHRPDSTTIYHEAYRPARRISPPMQEFVAEQSPQPGKELTLFLQYKSKIKKFVLLDGLNDLSVARLQLAFIEKFAWNTHNNGNDLPEIYIQDPISGVRHELEDLSDVKDRSVLVLNVEILDEVKKHIDEGLGGLRRMVEGVRTVVDGQQVALQQVFERQQDTAKTMATMATVPVSGQRRAGSLETYKSIGTRSSASPAETSTQVIEVQTLRRDLAVVRQAFSSFKSDVESSMKAVQSKASSIKLTTIDTTAPKIENGSGRAYVNAGKKSVGEESENIVNRVDDLQDIVEDLRKDVVTRGVRPLPRQLETVSKDISVATADLKKMQEYVKREKPIWTKIWEKELELVCNDREFLTLQEELIIDLKDDLAKATQTFALVEQATKQQNLHSTPGNPGTLRNTSRGLSSVIPDVDPVKAKDGVLDEVRALQPNHETRLEAIERAERARQKELEDRRDSEFKKELGSFVEEGKLRQSGGVEEAERMRKAKDERNRREGWEKQQARQAGQENQSVEAGPSDASAILQDSPTSSEAAAEDSVDGSEDRGAASAKEGNTFNGTQYYQD